MYTPVGSIALDMPFHDAIMLYFCLAVSGSRGSGGPGLGGSSSLSLCLPPRSSPAAAELANLPRSQPIRAPLEPAPGAGLLPGVRSAFTARLRHDFDRPRQLRLARERVLSSLCCKHLCLTHCTTVVVFFDNNNNNRNNDRKSRWAHALKGTT